MKLVIPAQAGIQSRKNPKFVPSPLDSRLRGSDVYYLKVPYPMKHIQQELISPEELVDGLQRGENPDPLFARLDVDACHFHARVDAGSVKPLVETRYFGFGEAASEPLIIEVDKAKNLKEQGRSFLFATGGAGYDFDRFEGSPPDRFIVAYKKAGSTDLSVDGHLFACTSRHKSVLLDNPERLYFTLNEVEKTLTINGVVLEEDKIVTIDPAQGKLWPGHQPIQPISNETKYLRKYIFENTDFHEKPSIALHVTSFHDLSLTLQIDRLFGTEVPIGLWRATASQYASHAASPHESY